MVRIAIVEDEELFVKELTEYLNRYEKTCREKIDVTVYKDGDGITSCYQSQFDIILMDIQMKFVDGMTAAEEIRKVDSKVIIIFITNMSRYAVKGYEVGAFDYILKPVSYFAFSQKLDRAISKIQRQEAKYVTVPIKGGMLRMDVSDIYYIESQEHNLLFHTSTGNHMVPSVTMKSVEEKLTGKGFSRGNQCYLINLEYVEGIQDKCALVNGEQLQLSRPRMKAFMMDLTKYWGEK